MTGETIIVEKLTGLVIFEVANQEFCVDIKDLSAILNPTELKQKIPVNAEEDIKVNIREQSISILSFKKMFGFKQKETHLEDLRILVVELNNKIFGLLVEKVKEVFTMTRELKKNMKFIPLKGKTNLLGVLRYEGRSIYVPDINKLMVES
jgi:chemotaxis signal transduction protein